MMEDTQAMLGLYGGWPQTTEEDFRYGAKANYHPLKVEAKHEPETWLNGYEYLGDNFHPFEDVLLPENCTIEPDKFFKELENFEDIKSDSLSFPISDLLESPFEENCLPALPGIDDLVFPPDEIIQQDQVFTPQGLSANSLQSYALTETPIKSALKNNHPPIIKINLKVVTVPKKRITAKPCPIVEEAVSEISKVDNITLKDALNLGVADNLLDELMEIVQPTPGRELEEINDYICSDSDDSLMLSSPSSSFSSDISSPNYGSPLSCYDSLDEDSFTVVTKNDITNPERKLSKPSTSKGTTKRLNGRTKLSSTEKKVKKMEQNKRAATRYRQKKKGEENIASDKLRVEEERQKVLTQKYKDLKYQIKIMKKLMRDAFIAKGLVSANAFK